MNERFQIENVVWGTSDYEFSLIDIKGREIRFELEGDCCSRSFFDADTKLDLKDILGQTLRKIETVNVGVADEEGQYDSVVQLYMTKLITDGGVFTLAWRNESNGYYSGYLTIFAEGTEIASWESEKLASYGIEGDY